MFFFETAQQVLFAQQFGLQPSGLGAFERMQEAAGSWSGRANIASTTAIRMAAVFRIEITSSTRLGAFQCIAMEHAIERGQNEERQKSRADDSADHNRRERPLDFGAASVSESHGDESKRRD